MLRVAMQKQMMIEPRYLQVIYSTGVSLSTYFHSEGIHLDVNILDCASIIGTSLSRSGLGG